MDDRVDSIRVRVDSLAYGPYGVARAEGRVIMIPRAVPGDELLARVVARKRNFAVGEIEAMLCPSPERQTPPCPYFESCGGCPWQATRYESQLAAKRKNLSDALARIAKLTGSEVTPVVASKHEYHYRRRVRLHVEGRTRLGFYRAFSHELIEIESCLIADRRADRCLREARAWLATLKTAVREIEIVTGDNDRVVLTGRAEGGLAAADEPACARFLEDHPAIGGVVLSGRGWRRSWGRARTRIALADGLELEIDADLFSQVNREGSLDIARQLLDWGAFDAGDRVLELYSGAGNFTLPIAKRAREVVAVEASQRAIENGAANGSLSGLNNIRWLGSPAAKAVRALKRDRERFSKIVLNPPRAGAGDLGADLAAFGAEKILYVSCEPPTLARDIATLGRSGYRLRQLRPFDLFPHSYRVEAVAELGR